MLCFKFSTNIYHIYEICKKKFQNIFAYLQKRTKNLAPTNGTSCFFGGTGNCGGGSACDLITLPVELTSFQGEKDGENNLITWETASEINSDYYELIIYDAKLVRYESYRVSAMGNTSNTTNYNFIHYKPKENQNYYQLLQYDYDGKFKDYGYISIDNTENNRKLISKINYMGLEVYEYYRGMIIIVYDNGTTEKKFQ